MRPAHDLGEGAYQPRFPSPSLSPTSPIFAGSKAPMNYNPSSPPNLPFGGEETQPTIEPLSHDSSRGRARPVTPPWERPLSTAAAPPGSHIPPMDEEGLIDPTTAVASSALRARTSGIGATPSPDARISKLREDFRQVAQKLALVEQQLANREDRAVDMSRSVERFSGALERLAQSQAEHEDSLRKLADESGHQRSVLPELTGALTELPSALGQLAETLQAVLDRVMMNQESISARISQGQEAMIAEWSQQQRDVVDRLSARNTAQDTLLRELAQNQQALLNQVREQQRNGAELQARLTESQHALVQQLDAQRGVQHDLSTALLHTQQQVAEQQHRQNELHERSLAAQSVLAERIEGQATSQSDLARRLLTSQEALLARILAGQSSQEQFQAKLLHTQESWQAQLAGNQEALVGRLETHAVGQEQHQKDLLTAQQSLIGRVDTAQSALQTQFDRLNAAQGEVTDLVGRVQGAMEELTATGRASTETFKRIGITEMEQRHTLSQQLTKFGRRFTVYVTVIGGLFLSGVAVIIGLMMMALDRPRM